MTLVVMEKSRFDSLEDERLGWACMEPTFEQIRGKSPAVKNDVITQLTTGQKALCMFRVMYDHSKNSASEYYAWMAYLQEQPGYWAEVTGGVHFFDDQPMLELLQETRERLAARNLGLGRSWNNATVMDLERDDELLDMMNTIFTQFEMLAVDSLARIGDYIRSHPEEFVELT